MTTARLGEAEWLLLEALLERLIPTDELGPGAHGAKVSRYIARRLAGPYRRHEETYVAGLARLDADAAELHGVAFVALAGEQQDALLSAAEARAADPFFELALAHAMEGMFGDPAYGGNHDRAGWKLMGYPGPRYEWTEPDQRLGRTGS